MYPHIRKYRGAERIKKSLFQLSHFGLEKYEGEPEGVLEKEWDNLIVLDACRYDMYQNIFGKCEKRVSLGSHSAEFLEKNFGEGDHKDIVYVNTNVHFTDKKMEDHIGRVGIFHTKFDAYHRDEEGNLTKSSIIKTPVEKAQTADKLFPEKKKIIHFMQPHRPFIGNELEEKGDVYKMAELGMIDRENVIEAYKQNIEILREEIKKLDQELEGKTVITGDHGELLGENGIYDHFQGSDAKVLREVPWDVISESTSKSAEEDKI
jgi:hypothetical protein